MNIPSKWQTTDRYDRIAWVPVIFIVRALRLVPAGRWLPRI
jgi:hypothetical protein